MLSGEDAPRILCIGMYRSDEASDSPFLQAWDRLQSPDQLASRGLQAAIATAQVRVSPLSMENCHDLLVKRLGEEATDESRRLAEELYVETGGNAYFFNELLECFDATNRQFQRIPLSQVIAEKLAQLPPTAAALLDTVAVSGQAIVIEEAIQASRCPRDGYTILTRMRNLRLVRVLGDGTHAKVDTYHDKIRETMLDDLDASRIRACHQSLLQVIESGGDAEHLRAHDLAFHADYTGDRQRAYRYGMLAGQQAADQHAPQAAAEKFEIAYRNSSYGVEGKGSFELAYGYTKSLLLIGHYERCRRILDEASNCTNDPVEQAHLARKAVWICRFYPTEYPFALREFGELCRSRGHTSRALTYFDKSLRVAEKHSARYEIAKTRLAKAKFLVELHATDTQAELVAAQTHLNEFTRMIDQAVASLEIPLGMNASQDAAGSGINDH